MTGWGRRFLESRVMRWVVALAIVVAGPLAPVKETRSTGDGWPDVPRLERVVPGLVAWLIGPFAATRAAAQTTPPDTQHNSPSTPWTAFAGGVNLVAGNATHGAADLAVPSVGAATAIGRTYNSATAGQPGPFGHGWFWSYGVRIYATDSGPATVVREDGRADTYTRSGDAFASPPGVHDHLARSGGGGFTLICRDQVRYTFTAAGRLQGIADRNGNTLSLAYAGDVPSVITDTAGRT